MKNKILSVRIEHRSDVYPDTSYLGKFTDEPTVNAVVRYGEHAGKTVGKLVPGDELPRRSREFRFFLPALDAHETGNPNSPVQDWRRMEALQNGEWCFIGIIAKCEFQLGSDVVQTFHSCGLWGIESDSDKSHFEQVAKDELCELRAQLEKIGFKKRAIDFAFKNIETKTY
jgi:hypothetical protein